MLLEFRRLQQLLVNHHKLGRLAHVAFVEPDNLVIRNLLESVGFIIDKEQVNESKYIEYRKQWYKDSQTS